MIPAYYADPLVMQPVTFKAVKVEKGHKFKGTGFKVSQKFLESELRFTILL